MTDKELAYSALHSDRDAFSLLLDKYREPLLAFVLKYVAIREDAEDICQKSFEKAYLNLARYDPEYAFSTWLYSIAHNEAIDHLRKFKNSINAVSTTTSPDVINTVFSDTPEDTVIIAQSVSEIIDHIHNLPEGYRRVAELRFIKDYAYEDIAAELNIPVGTVKTKLSRARKILVECVKDKDHGSNN